MDTVTIHYHRFDNRYADWTLWSWVDQTNLEVALEKTDDFGAIYTIQIERYPAKGNIGFLPKYKNWEDKDDPNRYWSRSMPHEIWILQGDATIYPNKPDTSPLIRKAFLDAPRQITVILSRPLKRQSSGDFNPEISLRSKVKPVANSITVVPESADSSCVLRIIIDRDLAPSDLPGDISGNGYKSGCIYLRDILTRFQTDAALGVKYTPEQSRFSLFAPGASKVTLNVYRQAIGGRPRKYDLQKNSDGVWSTTINADLLGRYYTYSVEGPDPDYRPDLEYIDPYARCVTSHDGRGIIFQDHTPIADPPEFPFDEAVIYEIHVRDFSIAENSGIRHKGQYLGFTETGTLLPGTDIKTGLDHLVELGVNTIQLMPIQDFEHDNAANNYFWGYMTVNFNSPDGWFATNQNDAGRIKEFKRLVDACHRKGIKVVLDVVYNHTAESNPEIRYNFNGIVPNYYYREKIDGNYWNGSGCGNEVRSELPMVRRFIVESLKYWVEEYKIDGYRFDLMGLIDMETMETIVHELQALRPDIFLYGEPWTAGDTPIQPTVKGSQRGKGFAVFNDHFRDALKGPWYNTNPGYIQSGRNIDGVKAGILGSIGDFADSPTEVINYVACHDGRTLWDQLVASTEYDGSLTDTELKAMDKLAAVLIFTAQGIPFIHAGQEMLRTKFGSHNSYNQPDKINKIRWDYKQENIDIFKYYQGLIRLRREHPMLRKTDAGEIRKTVTFLDPSPYQIPNNGLAYQIDRGHSKDNWEKILVLINPNHRQEQFTIPPGNWQLVVDHSQAGVDVIKNIHQTSLTLKPISALVLYQ